MAIADAYDAMVRDRPYRAAIGHDAAVTELRRCAQEQFDPELVERFCDLYAATPPLADPTLLIQPPASRPEWTARPARGDVATA